MKPILFNTEMVRAIQEGRKAVTRRVVKRDISNSLELDTDGSIIGVYDQENGEMIDTIRCAPYHPGDVLWVRETWCKYGKLDAQDHVIDGTENYYYRADGENPTPFNDFLVQHPGWDEHREAPVWHASIHMPKEAARLFLRVTGVRVERLQEITEEQAISEGAATLFLPSHRHREKKSKWVSGHCSECKHFDLLRGLAIGPCSGCHEGQKPHDGTSIGCTFAFELKPDTSLEPATIRFRYLWNSTDPKGGCYWSDNPWVWVVEFERISREAALGGGEGG